MNKKLDLYIFIYVNQLQYTLITGENGYGKKVKNDNKKSTN